MWIYGCLVIITSLSSVHSATFPPTPTGMCRCGVVGDPLVVFYDHQVALLTTANYFLISMAPLDPSLSDCSFQYWVQTKILDNGLVIPEGVTVILDVQIDGDISSRTLFLTDEGASMGGVWIDNRPFDDGVIRLEDVGTDGSISITPGSSVSCNLQFLVKMAGVHTRTSLLMDDIQGNSTLGLCGNCNGVRDDYGDTLEGNPQAPLLVSTTYATGRTDYPIRSA